MANHLRPPLYPLEVNEATGEPFIRLPKPLEKIILTPIRPTDADALHTHLNDLRVSKSLLAPYPYPRTNAEAAVAREVTRTRELLQTLQDTSEVDAGAGQKLQGVLESKLKVVDACPLKSIREVQEDGSDVLIGDFRLVRYNWGEVLDAQEREAKVAQNEAREAGDPEIVWMFGDFLAPSHHGRGIMTAALRAVIDNWAVPRMNVHNIRLTVGMDNLASVKVFQKLGFRLLHIVEGCYELPESKGGPGKVDVRVLQWTR